MSEQYLWIPAPHDPQGRAGGPTGPRWRGRLITLLCVAVVVLLVGAVVNGWRNRQATERRAAQTTSHASPAQPAQPAPTPSGGLGGANGDSGGEPLPLVACPSIEDEQSHLAYSCIDNYLLQDGADTLLGLRISLNHEVEPGWLISEGSGNPKSVVAPPRDTTVIGLRQALRTSPPTAQDVRSEVRNRAGKAVQLAYGDNPTSHTLSEHSRSFGGTAGYEFLTEITINPAFRALRKLRAKTERLWVVGLPTDAGVSIFMLSIPDNRKDLWPRAEATVGTIRVI